MGATDPKVQRWALILGASSGIGEATARLAAEDGYNICGVYLGRSRGEKLDAAIAAVKATGVEALYIRGNAADDEKRGEVITQLSEKFAAARAAGLTPQLGIVVHSLAFGSLQPFLPDGETPLITRKQMDMTSDVMAHSLVYWTQDLYAAGLIGNTTRIFATSSEGASKAVPMYGAVSAAKAAVEAHCRQLALELARLVPGATVTALRPGVVDTPALRKIPGSQDWIDVVMKKHPGKRLTTPDDVGYAIVALSAPGMNWVTGNTITIDGGEQIAGG
jgi:NAD(P)-dependent dehydrogenase (short-subunit alcohol dehydrogenase family)